MKKIVSFAIVFFSYHAVFGQIKTLIFDSVSNSAQTKALWEDAKIKKRLVDTTSNPAKISDSNLKNYNAVVDAVKGVITNPDKYLTKERFDLVKDYYKVRMAKDEILRYKNVNQYINPEGWSVYEILDKVNMKNIKEVYKKYYNFDNFYISNDKKEFKK